MIIASKAARVSFSSNKNTIRPARKISALQLLERRDNLQRIGFQNYPAYLRSSLWESIKRRVFERDNHNCCKCGKPARQVHHSHYDISTLRGENLIHLQSACGACHFKSHKRGEAKRLKPVAVVLNGKCPDCGVPKKTSDPCRACKKKRIALTN